MWSASLFQTQEAENGKARVKNNRDDYNDAEKSGDH